MWGLAGIVVGGMWLLSRAIPYLIDDSYIYFRYAENIARGLGPVFNRGDAPVEGFTSPLWLAALSAAGAVMGADYLPGLAVVFGLAAWLATVLLLVRASPPPPGAGPSGVVAARLLPALLWGCAGGAIYHAPTGLETPAFAALVLMFHGALAGTLPAWSGVVAAAAAMWVRPEAPWLIVAGGVQVLVAGALRDRRRVGLAMIVAVATGGALLLVVRWSLFHSALPNTYYAKRPSLLAGIQYVRDFLGTAEVFPLLLAGAAGAVLGERRHRGLAAASLAWILAAVLEGGDWMPMARFLQPALVLAGLASGGLGRSLTGDVQWRRSVVTGALLAPLLIADVWSGWHAGELIRAQLGTFRVEARSFAGWFHSTRLGSIALMDIGQVAFDNPATRIVDLDGLTDATIGRSGGGHLRKRFDLSYVFEQRRPDVIVVRVRKAPARDSSGRLRPRPEDSMSWPEGDLLKDPRLERDYQLLFVQEPRVPREKLYGLVVFLRRDVQLPPGVAPATDVVFLQGA